MNKISVVIITFNEEANIVRCLNSVLDIADEIIVVDSYSTDNTKALCLNFGVQFHEHAFEGYIPQKNFANSLAQFEYILSMDADEALSEELILSIQNAKRDFAHDGYFMSRMVNYCGSWIRHGSWYPDKKLRLFRKEKGSWEGVLIHETLEMQEGSTIGYLKGDILHYSYTSIEGHIAQFDKFTTIAANELFIQGRKATFIKLYLSPITLFVRGFFIRLGFLDGHYGVLICFVNSFATYMKYAKLKELTKNGKKSN